MFQKIMAFVEKVLDKSGVKTRFQELLPKRILEDLKKPKNACSPGWFKTPEQEEFYLFSAPIYRDAPMGFVVKKPWNGSPEKISLHDLIFFIKSSRNPGLICGFYVREYLLVMATRGTDNNKRYFMRVSLLGLLNA